MSGSEVIGELSRRSGGEWRPTATTVYPMIQMLEDDALVASSQSDDGKRRYQLTDAGRAEAERISGTSPRKPWEQPADEAPGDLFVAIAETARALVGAAATADDEQRADLVALLGDLRRRIAAIVPETKASGGRSRPGGAWPINIPDWIFGGTRSGTAAGRGAPGGFGRGGPWWLGGEDEQERAKGSSDSWDEEEDDEHDEHRDGADGTDGEADANDEERDGQGGESPPV